VRVPDCPGQILLLIAPLLVGAGVVALLCVLVEPVAPSAAIAGCILLAVGWIVGLGALWSKRETLKLFGDATRLAPWWSWWLVGGAMGSIALFTPLVLLVVWEGAQSLGGLHKSVMTVASATIATGVGSLGLFVVARRLGVPTASKHCATCNHQLLETQIRCPECGGSQFLSRRN
jgi:hypothetical protein